jgi:hypothetical protein
MKKIIFFILTLFLALTLTACANPYIGKTVRKDTIRKIYTPTGKNHRYILSHLVLDYTYTAIPDQQIIIIKGTVDDRHEDMQAHFVQNEATLEEAYLDIYFLDANRTVVDVCRKTFPLGHLSLPYPFEMKCHYTPEYQYATPFYKYKYTMYTPKGKAEKIYIHRLDIE